MEINLNKLLYWSSRILAMLFTLFISMFALDVFETDQAFIKIIAAFIIHLIPTWILIFTIIISWKREWIATVVFFLLGIFYIIIAWHRFPMIAIVTISGPLIVIGILYLINWFHKDKSLPETESKSEKNHHNRDDLAGEHRFGDAGQAAIAILFFIVWLGDTFIYKYTTTLNGVIPRSVRLTIGILLLVFSWYLARDTLRIIFKEEREKPEVVRKRAYKYCRHPMYLSEILLYLGLLIISLSFAAFIVWLLAIVFMYFLCRYEEKLLIGKFGDEYLQYMKEVPMWIPRFKKKKQGAQ